MTFVVPKNSVFISVGNGLTADQEGFVAAVEALLLEHGLQCITLGRNVHTSDNPLPTVRAIISATLGTVVIAFARLRITSAVEYPASAAPVAVGHREVSTVWNQIEAAMTYQAGHPLLILVERGLHPDGVIDSAVHPCLMFAIPTARALLAADVQSTLHNWITSLPAQR